MKWIRKLVLLLILGFIIYYFNDITDIVANILRNEPKIVVNNPNEYYKNMDFKFVKISQDFKPYSKQDVLDIFYTILDRGYDNFTFYCPKEYQECLNDIEGISKDQGILTYINNFVNPYNSFNNLKVLYRSNGEINIEIDKLYSNDEIIEINNKIKVISDELELDNFNDEDKILKIHDYIINHTKYDEDKALGTSNYKSNKAYGSLIEGYAVCGGYADAMALFLDNLKIINYKVSSETHVWNAIYLNDKWLHLDLTWDDPVTLNSNKDTLTHKFYLIDTASLEKYQISDHEFDKTVYQELA